ncbi:aldo/keto reductase [Kordiimonas aestuarii]|uniref:aldo/keto reductase n=1 Tax=Kordiimonas aestuarii TaxID=1005925 RepID=UPI0021CE36B5|nr:aldo/keto reductase [Kordiimonas aestuarii]
MPDPMMHTYPKHNLGQSGLPIGPIAYGCWRFAGTDVAAAQRKIETAIACGMTLIDTADIYGIDNPAGFGSAEALLGDVFKAQPALRYDMVLASKGGIEPGVPYNSTKPYLMRACEASLKRLRTDTIDLYQVHRPDMLAPFEEVADALSTLRSQGKIREAGVSNYSPSQFRALQANLDFPLASHQPEFSAMELGPLLDGTFDQCQETGALALAWSPLAGGLLIHGKTDEEEKANRLYAVAAILDAIAAQNSVTRAAAALAFAMMHPARVVPIVGTQTPARIKEAASAARVRISRADWYRVVEASLGARLP